MQCNTSVFETVRLPKFRSAHDCSTEPRWHRATVLRGNCSRSLLGNCLEGGL